MSFPGIFCARQIGCKPRWHKSHSPHGNTAGTITALPIQPSAPAPAATTWPLISWPEGEWQAGVGAHAVVVVTEVSVANAAAGNRHHHFIGCGLCSKRDTLERRRQACSSANGKH